MDHINGLPGWVYKKERKIGLPEIIFSFTAAFPLATLRLRQTLTLVHFGYLDSMLDQECGLNGTNTHLFRTGRIVGRLIVSNSDETREA